MKYIYYLAFVTGVIVLGWIFRPVEEHMTVGTSKHPIYGPKGVDFQKCARTYPELYGPDEVGFQGEKQRKVEVPGTTNKGVTTTTASGKAVDITPISTTAMYEDDGEFRSDTATRNAAYMNVFTFQPYAKMDFPVSGPPQPYLSDFANFHK
jgi:hypothetical protein